MQHLLHFLYNPGSGKPGISSAFRNQSETGSPAGPPGTVCVFGKKLRFLITGVFLLTTGNPRRI
jgi:hypothetical protein